MAKPSANRAARLRRSMATRVGCQPAVEEAFDPAVEWRIVERMHGKMHAALLGARQFQPLCRFQRPDLFHLQGDLGMERSEEHTSELQSHLNLVCRLLLEKKKYTQTASAYQLQVCEPSLR